MTIEYSDENGEWKEMGPGSVHVARILNDCSMYSVMAKPLDGDTLMIFCGFVPAHIPDPWDPDNKEVALLWQGEINSNPHTKGTFRYVPSGTTT